MLKELLKHQLGKKVKSTKEKIHGHGHKEITLSFCSVVTKSHFNLLVLVCLECPLGCLGGGFFLLFYGFNIEHMDFYGLIR